MRAYRGAFLAAAGAITALALVSCSTAPNNTAARDGVSAPKKAASAKVLLRYHLKKGDKYELSVSNDHNMSRTIMGNAQTVKTKIDMVYGYDISDVSKEGVATIKATIKRVALKMEAPGQSVDYDSSKPGSKPPPEIAGMVGQAFSMKMNDRGEIETVKSGDAAEKQFGAAALKESLESMSGVFPDDPVATGAKWRKSTSMSKGFPMTIDSSWTLKELSDGVAMIDTKATIKPDESNSSTVLPDKTKLNYHLNGTGKGSIEIDLASGFPKKSVFSQKVSGTLVFTNPKTAKEVSMPVRDDGTVTMRSKKV